MRPPDPPPPRPMTPAEPTALHRLRLDAVLAAVREVGGGRALDLGCGDGAATLPLAALPEVTEVVALDPDRAALARLAARLTPELGAPVILVHGSVLDAPASLAGRDVAVAAEVLEHLPPDRLSLLETALFVRLRPRRTILTTPNADANAALGVPARRLRHPDHKFEWGAARFARWAEGVAARHRLDLTLHLLGAPVAASQMAVFDRLD